MILTINDYISNRKQGSKIENTYSKWLDIIFGVSQGSILEPLLFNAFLAICFFLQMTSILPVLRITIHHT